MPLIVTVIALMAIGAGAYSYSWTMHVVAKSLQLNMGTSSIVETPVQTQSPPKPVNSSNQPASSVPRNSGDTAINVPPLPSFMSWTPDSPQLYEIVIDTESATSSSPAVYLSMSLSLPKDSNSVLPSVPAIRWTYMEKGQGLSGSSTILDRFKNYYDSILTKDGWSYDSVSISGLTIYGVAADVDYASQWSYLKSNGRDLYMIVLGYSSFRSNGNPGSTSYEVDVSDPIPLKQLTLH